jgi:hypothetical protein
MGSDGEMESDREMGSDRETGDPVGSWQWLGWVRGISHCH